MNQKKTKTDTERLAEVLTCLREIGGDLSFLHTILFDFNGVEDESRKVQIALPYLEGKVNFINDTIKDYVEFLPEELRADLIPVPVDD